MIKIGKRAKYERIQLNEQELCYLLKIALMESQGYIPDNRKVQFKAFGLDNFVIYLVEKEEEK